MVQFKYRQRLLTNRPQERNNETIIKFDTEKFNREEIRESYQEEVIRRLEQEEIEHGNRRIEEQWANIKTAVMES